MEGAEADFRLRPIPPPLPIPDWLETDQTFCFGVTTPDEAVTRGVKIMCGGTNAAGPGYAGGPYVWDGKDTIYNMNDGKPVDVAAIRAKVDAAHAKGLKVIGELMRLWDREMLYVKHPEWQELTSPDAKPRGPEMKNEPIPVTGCWNSPYGDFYIKQTVELVKRLGWDGANLDGFGCWTQCYCQFCRESYRRDTGKDIPYKPVPAQTSGVITTTSSDDLNDPEFRQYLKWRLNRFTLFVDRWMKAVHEVKPDFAAFFWSTGPGRWWHWSFAPLAECSDAANRLLSAPIVELFWDFPPNQGSNLLPSFVVRYYRGLTAERPVWMLPYFCTQGQQAAVAPPVECAFRVLTVLTNGGRAAQGMWQNNNSLPPDFYTKLIKEREPYTTRATSVKWAAMFISETDRLMYNIPGKTKQIGGGWIGSGVDTPDLTKVPPSERRLPYHMESAIGVFRAAQEEHLPLDIITEQDVEEGTRLNLYKVLVLPNTACISQKGLENIRKFVNAGGGLVAMQESSRCDEFATPRADFGLSDLFKVSFVGVEDHTARWPNYPNPIYVAVSPHEITDSDVIRQNYRYQANSVDYIGMTAKVSLLPGAEVIVKQGLNAQDPDRPFLVISNAGKGRVAYFAADIGQSYFVVPYQYERKLIANSIRWAAGNAQPPVEVTAPMCVQATFYEQNGGKRTVVHLLNEINTTGGRALPEGDSSMREEIVPLAGIKVLFRRPGITRVHLEPEGIELEMHPTPAGTEVVVPELKLHSMVVAE